MQNAFIESFNGRLRDELLNETLHLVGAGSRCPWMLAGRIQRLTSAFSARMKTPSVSFGLQY
jgi:Integrase core domain